MASRTYTLDLTTGRGTQLPEPHAALVAELAPRLLQYADHSIDWLPQPFGELYITAQGGTGAMAVWLWADSAGNEEIAQLQLCRKAKYGAKSWEKLHDLSERQLATNKSGPPPQAPWCAYWCDLEALPYVSAVLAVWALA